jgi:hypothetical protein
VTASAGENVLPFRRLAAGKESALFTRPAVLADAAPLAAALREQDRREYEGFGEPAELLAIGIEDSWWCHVAEDDAGYVAIWGIHRTTLLGGDGYAWCATTPRVLLHKRQFLLGSRAWVAAMQSEFHMITGWCAADYALSLRWLTRWLGFSLGETRRMPSGLSYVNFYWWRD